MNSLLLLEEISAKEFIHDVRSMLVGIESNSFKYGDVVCILPNLNKKLLKSKMYKSFKFFR